MLVHYFMRQSQRVLRVAIIGAPLSGRHTLALHLADVFDVPLLTFDRLYEIADPKLQAATAVYHEKNEPLPPELAFSLLRQQVFSDECVLKGWIMCGFPETRAQEVMFCRQGIRPQKTSK